LRGERALADGRAQANQTWHNHWHI
jgi:hypothetical protein